ncbi:GerAB/ArcD/ProY family transporter [Pullulanibacillus sp. KACC 23026]|uniref:GerAB/ArcD/ProY family transporter n=1 Tax=Pullulanibacillus sp. KACC 23026 TaxID=3028315 RepID=UPI0023B0B287|nr:GerAB/ArcD/ProY family transporter [Pullulanibacillus sp. KACC 23026]WEG12556.1 GerAB/ArcD/ProY family transporter [Pullulanibacillus sp. KACC 23026]
MQRRFNYYLILLNMISNIMMFTPEILIRERFTGAVQGLIWAFPIGTFFIFMFTYLINDFQGQSIIELMKNTLPVWLQKGILVYFTVLFFITGVLSISVFTFIMLTFMNQDTDVLLLTLMLGGFVSVFSVMKSDKVLYFLEIILVLALPFLAFILYKTLVNPYLNWTSIIQMATYVNRLPDYMTLSTATYIYSGYANMVIFNKCFTKKSDYKHIWVMGILGFLISVHTFFVPIGFNGTVSVGVYEFPWVITADSIRLSLGIIERLIYPFLLLYTMISLINSVIHLHVTTELLKGVIPSPRLWKGKLKWVCPCFFLVAIFLFNSYSNDQQRLYLSVIWLMVRFPSEGILLLLLYWIKRRRRNAQKT